jgi:hypothetical protein
MQTNTISEVTREDLERVVGGQEASPAPNRQDDTIGVKAGSATVGITKEGERSNYGLCVEAGLKQNWKPEEIRSTCGLPPP